MNSTCERYHARRDRAPAEDVVGRVQQLVIPGAAKRGLVQLVGDLRAPLAWAEELMWLRQTVCGDVNECLSDRNGVAARSSV